MQQDRSDQFFRVLFAEWKQNIMLVLPENAKLFFGATLLNLVRFAQQLFSGFLVYFLLYLFLGLASSLFFSQQTEHVLQVFWLIPLFLGYGFILRPSVDQKNASYYAQQYLLYFQRNFFVTFFNFFVSALIIFYIPSFLLFAPFLFFLLFVADSPLDTSVFVLIKRTFLLVLYNIPFLLLMSGLIFIAAIPSLVLVQLISKKLVLFFFYFNFLPIAWAFYSTLYVKKVHEQYRLILGD